MSGYALHPDAFADLDEIWDYIAADNLDAADRVIADIRPQVVDGAGFTQDHAQERRRIDVRDQDRRRIVHVDVTAHPTAA